MLIDFMKSQLSVKIPFKNFLLTYQAGHIRSDAQSQSQSWRQSDADTQACSSFQIFHPGLEIGSGRQRHDIGPRDEQVNDSGSGSGHG